MNLTQKISQMTPKGADLAATDLIEVSTLEAGSYVTKSITGQELIDAIPLPPSGLTVGTTPISSGTIGRVLFEGTGNVLQQSSSLFWNSTNNRLGIGTSTPEYPLDILGNLSGYNIGFKLRNSATTGYTEIMCFNNGGTLADRMYMGVGGTTTGDAFQNRGYFVASNNLEGVNFTATKPTTGDIRFFTGGVNERLRIHGSGNIGINTTTDAGFRLDVNGTARVVNQATIQTLTIGLGNNSIATNTALGFQVLANANASNTGFNTGVGYQSLSSIVGNGYNTAVGYQALKNSTASTNTAVGFQAGLNNSASDNVFIGHQAGLASTNTSSTIAIGAYALLSNTTGTALTAIGRGALENATGGGNVAIGFWAGRTHTTGTNNIFIGNSSTGVSNTDSNRTWIGNSSTTSTWLAGNVLINTTTDAGFRLDVNGTARVSGNLTAPLFWANANATTIIYSDDAAASQNGISLIRSNRTGVGNQAIVNFIYQTTEVARFTTSGTLAINTISPNASSIVDITSTTKGFLPPRMTTTQRNAIASPAAGLQVFDTTLNMMSYYNGTIWVSI
jgi:hypothetical protein